ncbi:MAG TPA: hypothetical protein VJZ32_10525 [Candidatus Bathyarchaeia archaeon]|nr:hypothetical protein [Candidatus Bathyarchaeia archaeon]HKM77660.1 hypothetical protein [Candidatus Bathyarchaeia archaeon]
MGKLSVLIPDALERKFRFAIAAIKSGKQGDLSDAMIEAIEDWLKKHKKADTRRRREQPHAITKKDANPHYAERVAP